MKTKHWLVVSAIGGAAGFAAARLYRRYQQDLQTAQQRLLSGSQVIQTAVGPIEYVSAGDGPPVLLVHGGGGGYDQGLLIAGMLGTNFRWIIPSRFGYLRTPLPPIASPQAQADAHAALLDALDIPRAAIVGMSAGGPSSLQFALRHPRRCSALVLLSAISKTWLMQPMSPLAEAIFKWDALFWLISTLLRPCLTALVKASSDRHAQPTSAEAEGLVAVMKTMLPVSARWPGYLNDMIRLTALDRYPLETIGAPTLVVHAANDHLVTLDHAVFSAQTIPGARLIQLESGGHLLIGQQTLLQVEVGAFLKQHAS